MYKYTTVFYGIKEFLQVSVIEYHILDIVFGNSKNNTWAYISKQTIANMLSVSRGTVINAINNLEKRELLMRHPETSHLRVHKIIQDMFDKQFDEKVQINGCTNFEQLVQSQNDSSKIEQGCIEIEQIGVQKLDTPCTKIEHNKDIYKDTSKDINKKNKQKEIPIEFQTAYNLYLKKMDLRSVETEFDFFKKKHNDYKEVLKYLVNAVERQNQIYKEKGTAEEFQVKFGNWLRLRNFEAFKHKQKSQAQLEAERWEEHRKRVEEAEARYWKRL